MKSQHVIVSSLLRVRVGKCRTIRPDVTLAAGVPQKSEIQVPANALIVSIPHRGESIPGSRFPPYVAPWVSSQGHQPALAWGTLSRGAESDALNDRPPDDVPGARAHGAPSHRWRGFALGKRASDGDPSVTSRSY